LTKFWHLKDFGKFWSMEIKFNYSIKLLIKLILI
jgi:hypothetical protein